MPHRTPALAASFIALILAGCAGTMPFQDDTDTVPSGGKAVFLLTATLENAFKPSIHLEPMFLLVCKKGATGSGDCILFRVDQKAKPVTKGSESASRYYLRVQLESGEYEIVAITGRDFFMGSYIVPIHADMKSNGTGVLYLGHVSATLRQRKEGEFRAGPPEVGWGITGLIVGVVTAFGFYEGTFDTEITDQSQIDIADFRTRFPVLRSIDIQTAILPPFDRAKAQWRWEHDPYNRLRETR